MPDLEEPLDLADDEELFAEGAEDPDEDDDDDDDDDDVELSDDDRQALQDLLSATTQAKGALSKVIICALSIQFILQINFQIRRFAFGVIHSTTLLLPLWRKTCVSLSLNVRLIPRDVKTRWNSTYDMLHVALIYRSAIDAMTADKKANLRALELDDTEWEILKDLHRLYKELTVKFSEEGIATIAHVLPAMDKIDNMLTTEIVNKTLSPVIKHALMRGHKKMNEYYSKSDQSYAYRIAM
ncbi:hypothetical protein B0H16DRAFT_1321768, partial [Mycena metata]